MQRWLLNVAYDGTRFHGWQWQSDVPSIEGRVKEAVSKVANHPVSLTVCGRTDRGVHSVGQCVHFDSDSERSLDQWLCGINTHLPSSIRIARVAKVEADFHARFSATARLYRYCIEVGPVPSPMLRHAAWHRKKPLDVDAMRRAMLPFLGKHDFSAFRGPHCQAKTPIRNLMRWEVDQVAPSVYVISIQANAFLHHMVRLMVGALVLVGEGKREEAWLFQTLENRQKPSDLVMAPSAGLYFWQATYPHDKLGEMKSVPDGGWFSLLEFLLQGKKDE